jgi:dihydroorotate dehydrogenase
MVYKGPNIVNTIKNDLGEILLKEGVKNFTEIVGNKTN